jgi:hypothetical protein
MASGNPLAVRGLVRMSARVCFVAYFARDDRPTAQYDLRSPLE